MTLIERYRHWFAHERDCNAKMIGMLESVPAESHSDPRFVRAVTLAAHLVACRENSLIQMRGGDDIGDWWPKGAALGELRPRIDAMEAAWSDYLGSLSDADLAADYEFAENGLRFRWSVEGQIFQLLGHAYYHRGQIAQIVDTLGGETVDTDYVEWALPQNPRYGLVQRETT